MDDLLEKVDKMHITQEDLDEAVQKLKELEMLLDKGDDDNMPDIGDLFAQDDIPAPGLNPAAQPYVPSVQPPEVPIIEEKIDVSEPSPEPAMVAPEMTEVNPEPETGSISMRDDPTPQEAMDVDVNIDVPPSVPSKGKISGDKQHAVQGKRTMDDIMSAANVKGGKTRRRRHQTKKGGYVIKKNSTRHRKKKKARKTRMTSTTSGKRSTRKTSKSSK
jgi:hypothetical protein